MKVRSAHRRRKEESRRGDVRRKLAFSAVTAFSGPLQKSPLQHFRAISVLLMFMVAKRQLGEAGSHMFSLAHPLASSSWPLAASERDTECGIKRSMLNYAGFVTHDSKLKAPLCRISPPECPSLFPSGSRRVSPSTTYSLAC